MRLECVSQGVYVFTQFLNSVIYCAITEGHLTRKNVVAAALDNFPNNVQKEQTR